MPHFIKILILFLILIANIQHIALADEKLHYQATYKGVLSLFQKLNIADVWYNSESVDISGNNDSLQRISLSVSSENFSMVERLSPFRYRFQSFFSPESSNTWLFENLRVTKNGKKIKHKVGLFDLNRLQVKQYKGSHKKLVITPEMIRQVFFTSDYQALIQKLELKASAKPLLDLDSMPVDRLTLLQLITKQVRETESSKQYFITDGDELMTYQVQLGKQELIQLDKKHIKATKVKIEAFDLLSIDGGSGGIAEEDNPADENLAGLSPDEKKVYRHPPVYVWFSADERCVPLRFVNHHALGEFTVEMVGDV